MHPSQAQRRTRVVLVDAVDKRAAWLARSLEENGYEVIAVLASPAQILDQLDELAPDIVLADMHSPGRDAVEDIRRLLRLRPCAVVMYAAAGDLAYQSPGVPGRHGTDTLHLLLDVATGHPAHAGTAPDDPHEAREDPSRRKHLDRAKSLLLRHHALPEADAHRALQHMAMNQRITITEAARQVIAMLSVLPAVPPPS